MRWFHVQGRMRIRWITVVVAMVLTCMAVNFATQRMSCFDDQDHHAASSAGCERHCVLHCSGHVAGMPVQDIFVTDTNFNGQKMVVAIVQFCMRLVPASIFIPPKA